MEQLGENLMKNLCNELQDSKREMEEKLNDVMIQTQCYAESVQNNSQEKNQTPNGTCIDFRAIFEETKNAELVEEKERKLRSKNLIIHGAEEFSIDNKDDAIKSNDIYINNFIAALKVTSNECIEKRSSEKRSCNEYGRGKKQDFIKSKNPEGYSRMQNYQRY